MNITVQSIKFNADQKLVDFIKRKTAKLDHFMDNIIEGVCYLRLENVENEENKIVELKMNIPGSQLFAKAQAKSFEEATDVAVDSLKRQIDKYKTKTRVSVSNHKELLPSEDEF